MASIIGRWFKSTAEMFFRNIHDVLILMGIVLFIITMFKYVSEFAGCITLSIVLVVLGIILSKLRAIR